MRRILLFFVFSLSSVWLFAQEEFLRSFYKEYAREGITIIEQESIIEKFCSTSLTESLNREILDFDPFLRAQDLITPTNLRISKCAPSDTTGWFFVSYSEGLLEGGRVEFPLQTIPLKVSKENGDYRISYVVLNGEDWGDERFGLLVRFDQNLSELNRCDSKDYLRFFYYRLLDLYTYGSTGFSKNIDALLSENLTQNALSVFNKWRDRHNGYNAFIDTYNIIDFSNICLRIEVTCRENEFRVSLNDNRKPIMIKVIPFSDGFKIDSVSTEFMKVSEKKFSFPL